MGYLPVASRARERAKGGGMKRMSRLDAIRAICAADGRKPTKSDRTAVAMYKRARYAAGALGLTVGEIDELMHFLEYHDKNGKRYDWLSNAISRISKAPEGPEAVRNG